MATVLREVDRPAFLDAPAERLPFGRGGGVVAPPRRREPEPRDRGADGEARAMLLSERLRAERGAGVATAGGPRGGEATLDELLVGAWEGLSARRPVTCPVCAASMLPRSGAAGGRCPDCASQLL